MRDPLHLESQLSPPTSRIAAAVFEAIQDAIVWTDAAGRVAWLNRGFEQLVNRDRTQLIGLPLMDVLPLSQQGQVLLPATHPLHLALSHRCPGEATYDFQRGEHQLNLDITWNCTHDCATSSGDLLAVFVMRDVTQQRQVADQLLYDALHDALTGLPNRLLFRDRLAHAVQVVEQCNDRDFALLLLDLDRFQVINDSLGHHLGDQLLSLMAQRIKTCLKPEDTLAHIGGDEFAILLENIQSEQDAVAIAEQLLQALSQPCHVEGHEVFMTVSIGIVFSTAFYEQPDDLLRNADIAMYRAKNLGRARHQVFENSMHKRAVTLLQLENDLRRAIERQEFSLQYQPIIALGSERLTGFEALLRWHHPERGLVSPAEFIPLAEDAGLIIPIGHWVLREACRQMQAWLTRWQPATPADRPLTMSVNLSARQFAQADLIEQVDAILAATQLEGRHLKLEVTESVIMGNAEAAAVMLQKLKDRGIRIAVDDFGTGYSSLSYLYRLPIDTLKIDRSFINSVDKDGEKLELVRTIVSLAWNIGMDIVAEGIETPTQLAQLRSLRCEAGQGFLFSQPLDAEAAAGLMRDYLVRSQDAPLEG